MLSINNNQLKAQNMEDSLNTQQQKIATIAANTAIGNLDALKIELKMPIHRNNVPKHWKI